MLVANVSALFFEQGLLWKMDMSHFENHFWKKDAVLDFVQNWEGDHVTVSHAISCIVKTCSDTHSQTIYELTILQKCTATRHIN